MNTENDQAIKNTEIPEVQEQSPYKKEWIESGLSDQGYYRNKGQIFDLIDAQAYLQTAVMRNGLKRMLIKDEYNMIFYIRKILELEKEFGFFIESHEFYQQFDFLRQNFGPDFLDINNIIQIQHKLFPHVIAYCKKMKEWKDVAGEYEAVKRVPEPHEEFIQLCKIARKKDLKRKLALKKKQEQKSLNQSQCTENMFIDNQSCLESSFLSGNNSETIYIDNAMNSSNNSEINSNLSISGLNSSDQLNVQQQQQQQFKLQLSENSKQQLEGSKQFQKKNNQIQKNQKQKQNNLNDIDSVSEAGSTNTSFSSQYCKTRNQNRQQEILKQKFEKSLSITKEMFDWDLHQEYYNFSVHGHKSFLYGYSMEKDPYYKQHFLKNNNGYGSGFIGKTKNVLNSLKLKLFSGKK